MTNALVGKRILVVEDEYLIASDLKRALQAEGATIVGPTGKVEKGLALIEEDRPDAAVLDVNLMGRCSFPIADRLTERDVPYIFVTGYDGWAMPESHRATPRIAKPFTVEMVVNEVDRLFAVGAA